jgi:hypothetical protein
MRSARKPRSRKTGETWGTPRTPTSGNIGQKWGTLRDLGHTSETWGTRDQIPRRARVWIRSENGIVATYFRDIGHYGARGISANVL